MVNEQLRTYVKSQLERGVKAEAIKAAILKIGWSPKDAEEAMQSGMPPAAPTVPSVPAAPVTPSFSSTPAASPASNLPSTLVTPTELVTTNTPVTPKNPAVAAVPVAPASLDSLSSAVTSSFPQAGEVPFRITSDAPKDKSLTDTLQIPTEPAESTPEIIPINAEPEPKAAKPSSRKFSPLLIVLLVALIGVEIVFIYWYTTREQAPASPPAVAKKATSTLSVATTTMPIEDPDIAAVKQAFAAARVANAKKDAALYRQYLSSSSQAIGVMLSFSTQWVYQDIELATTTKEGPNVLGTINSTKANGLVKTDAMLFVKEDGVWKLGLVETLQRALAAQKMAAAQAASSSSAGLPDLVVTDIKIFPVPPKVNDANTEVQVFIKNIGTAPAVKGVSATGQVGGGDIVQGGNLSLIATGQTVTWEFKPYGNKLATYKDKLGTKLITIVLNPDNSTKEKDTTNNRATTTVDFVQ